MNQVLGRKFLPFGRELLIVQGDITLETVDVIVNAANSCLLHGGGVAGVIVRKGGQKIQQESNDWVREHGPVSHAEPAYTSAGHLPCRYVIHAVGPVWGEGDEDAKLSKAVIGSLLLADKLDLKTISLPAISTGIFGFPKVCAAKIIIKSISGNFLDQPESSLQQVRMILVDQVTVDVFLKVFHSAALAPG